MKPTFEQHNDFLDLKELQGVALQHNDYVSVKNGEHVGDAGSVVSLEELGNDPLYLVELESQKDALIRQSHLELIAHGR